MPRILSAFLPSVHDITKEFADQLYLRPYGADALGHALLINDEPHLPESAAMDFTALGAGAIRAVASIRNSADEMALANQQAQAIARNTKIAAVRSYEALRSYQHIFNEELKESKRREMKKGPGGAAMSLLEISSSRPKSSSSLTRAQASSFLPGLPLRGLGDVPLKPLGEPLSKAGGSPGAKPAHQTTPGAKEDEVLPALPGMPGAKEDEFNVDEVVYLKQYLEDAFKSLRQASMDAVVQANSISKKYHEVQNASRAFSEALNLPGLPTPPTIPPVMLQPPRRPRDLSPFWLDVPYAISPGGDPYAVHDGKPRNAMGSLKMGVPGFNPFEGTVPFSETGLRDIYANVGHHAPKMEGIPDVTWQKVKLKPGPMEPPLFPPNDTMLAPFIGKKYSEEEHRVMPSQVPGLQAGLDVEAGKGMGAMAAEATGAAKGAAAATL